jgi:nitroreductase
MDVAPPAIFDLLFHQRACRAFTAEDVDDSRIELCLRAATHAPSAENRQPWAFIVVRDATRRAAIGQLMQRAWSAGGRRHSEPRLDERLFDDVDRGVEGGVAAAPVLVVVCGDSSDSSPATLPSSVFPATQNLLVAASALGLGSAMTTLALAFSNELAELLALPDYVHPMAVVPLGWPAQPLGPPHRVPVAEKAHREQWGARW